MSQPQFPDPTGRRELLTPGATAHKAGMSLEDRVKALEQGALGRPGPGVSDGSTITSDSSQTGGAYWSPRGKTAGYEQATANIDRTVNNLQLSTALFTGFSVTGDNTHYLWVEFWCFDFVCTNGTGDMSLVMRHGSTDCGYADAYAISPSNRPTGPKYIKQRLDPFSGSRTFNMYSYNSNIGAGAVLRVEALAASPAYLHAYWGDKA